MNIVGTALDAAKVLVSPCEKLVVAVQSAIGKAYEPKYIKRMADAKAYEISTIGQAMRENSDIPIIFEKGDITFDTTDFDVFIKRTQNRLAYQELTKQKNIENVANQAYLLLEGSPPVENKPLDSDWLLRFFNSVQDVSNVEMQQLWAKILAGEILSPGAVSLRTLAVLTQMTAAEARQFETLARYVLHYKNTPSTLPDDYFVFTDDHISEITHLSFAEIFLLDEIGLLSSNTLALFIEVRPHSTEYIYCQGKKVIEVRNSGETIQNISRNAYILTSAGRELLGIISNESDAQDSLSEYFEKCKEIVVKDGITGETLPPAIDVVAVE